MAGLLDGVLGASFDDPRTAATLALAQGLLTAPKPMRGLNDGLLGYQNAMAEAKKAKQMEEMRQMQLMQHQMAMKQAEQAQAKQLAVEQAYRGALRTPEQTAMGKFGGPTVAAANAAPGMAPSLDQNALIQNLMQADPMAAAQMLQPKQAKIKDYKEVRMPDGSVQIVGFDEFGKVVDTGRTPFKAEEVRDFGGHLGGVDPITGKVRKIGDKSQSPDSKASNALGWANYGLSKDRLSLDREGAGAGKAPQGYRFKADGSLEAIPGGPADIKAGELGAKTEAKKASTIAQASSVLDTIDEARGLVGITTAGFGSALARVPTSDARNLKAKLETVKANLGFDRLQQMRDQSPTGGALGAVAVQELTALQSTVASLDQAQSPAQLDAALKKIDTHYSNWLKTMGAERKRGPTLDPKLIMEEADAIIRGGL